MPCTVVPAKSLGKTAERLGAAVDDRHGVPAGQQVERQRGTHPAATDDDDVHAATLGSRLAKKATFGAAIRT